MRQGYCTDHCQSENVSMAATNATLRNCIDWPGIDNKPCTDFFVILCSGFMHELKLVTVSLLYDDNIACEQIPGCCVDI